MSQEAAFTNLGPAYLRSFSRGRAASFTPTPPPEIVTPPPAPSLTQSSVNHVVPSENSVSHGDLISALAERRATYPESSFHMSFGTEENAVPPELREESIQDTIVEVESKIEPTSPENANSS